MEERELDKYFKDAKRIESLDPPEFVWDGLENDLKKSRRGRRYLVWWFLGLVMVLVLSILLLQVKNTAHTEAKEHTSIAKNEKQADTQNENDNNTLDKLNEESIISEELDDETFQPVDLNQQDEDIPLTKSERSVGKSNVLQPLNNPLSTKEAETIDNNSSYNISNNLNIPADDNQSIQTNVTIFPAKKRSSEKLLNRATEINESNRDELAISKIVVPSTTLLVYARNFEDLSPSYPKLIRPISKYNNSLTAFLHVGSPNFTHGAKSEDIAQYETDWYSYGAGLRYQREVIDRLHFGIGVNFRQSKRKLYYESEELSISGYEARRPLEPPLEYGKLISEGEQKYSFVDLALGFDYDILSKGIRISIGLDALVNFKLISTGKTLDNEFGIMRYDNDEGFYQSSLGLGVSPSISIGVPLSQNTFLKFTPNFTTYFQDLKNEELGRALGYSNGGLDIGMSRRF